MHRLAGGETAGRDGERDLPDLGQRRKERPRVEVRLSDGATITADAVVLAAPLGGRLIGKVKPSYVIFASTIVAGVGMYLFTYIDPRSTAINIIVPLMVMAFGRR